jgi:hypothetical protein
MFRLGATSTGGKVNPSGNLFFTKKLWLDGCLGVEPRRIGSPVATLTWLGGWWEYFSGGLNG